MTNVVEDDVQLVRIQVAERLGWRSIEYSKDAYLIGYPTGRKVLTLVPSYTRDIKSAWTIVDYLAPHGIHVQIQVDPASKTGQYCSVSFTYQQKVLAQANDHTLSMTICRAFLQIHGDYLACVFKDPPA